MPLDASTTESLSLVVADLVYNLIVLILLSVILVLDLKYVRASRRLARDLGLPQGQWLRPVKMLFFDPAIYVLVVGVLTAKDVVQNWEHAVAGVLGAAVGAVVGRYRYGIQYVRALPEYKAIIFVRSRAEYVALAALFLVDWVAEQERIPVVGPLTLLITGFLCLLLAESITRSVFCFRRYQRDTAAATVANKA